MSEYPLRIPEYGYWKEQIKCQAACPVHTDARGYVRAIAAGDDLTAYLIARGPNPLASICGRVCGAPCEAACRRGDLDSPIAIRALKRFVCSQFGPEGRKDSGSLIDFLKNAAAGIAPVCRERDELLPFMQALTDQRVKRAQGKSVGVIGSGPAGLSAAHDLAILGFSVTIYEMEPILAGMLSTGIPEYRLPRDLIQAEVDVILALGVEAATNCTIGRDVSLSELRGRHDAVVIAVGAKKSRRLNIPGADSTGVLGGVEFLRDVSIGNPPQLGRRVVVIGGGNVAFDVGRTVLRQISMDAARVALRSIGVREVHLCSLESLEEMPADDIEIIEGAEEGILRHNSLGPKEILVDAEGRVTGVRFQKCLRVFDENRRFSPLFDDNDLTTIECEHVLLAIGQSADIGFVDSARDGIAVDARGLIHCDPLDGSTSAPDIFIAGDLAYGPKLLIHAVASGKAVARAVYSQLMGHSIGHEQVELHFPIADYDREKDYEKRARLHLPTLPAEDRTHSMSATVERELDAQTARCEAMRCLDCGVNTIFDGEKCILCGGCADVCPELCLRLVSLDRLSTDSTGSDVIDAQLGGHAAEDATAIIKDETICIRCGLCAQRCPTGAITMERFQFWEKPVCQVA
jgi:NADPH-dependent glutamate synthase beta subunit-like oxidoreductase/ferredoxin